MRQYEKNINKVMPIYNFGTIENERVEYCILKEIADFDGMYYFIQLLSKDREVLGARWITRHMYRYHIMQKPYQRR